MEWLISWVGLGVLDMRIKTKITASHTFNEKNKQTNKQKENMNMKVIFAVMNTTWAVMKIRSEKIQGFEPMTSPIPMQRSTNWANKVLFPKLLK